MDRSNTIAYTDYPDFTQENTTTAFIEGEIHNDISERPFGELSDPNVDAYSEDV